MGTDSGLLSNRVKSHLNMFFVVMATLILGNALHVSVVTNEHSITAFPVVAQFVAGAVLGAVGVWFRTAPREWEIAPPTEGDDEEFDEEASPLDSDSLERLEE